ncbi:MAG: TetR/AcrR family transcriptional regulator [Cephaloticoccus sp.]
MAASTVPPPVPSPTVRILEQARGLLLGLGYSGFTMDALAAELAMSKRTLYQHFRGKDAMLRAAISDFGAGMRAEADTLLAQRGVSFAEKLRGLTLTLAERLGKLRPEVLQDIARNAPLAYRHLEHVRGETITHVFGRFIEEGQATGAIRDDVSPVFAGEFYMHAMQGIMRGDTLRRLHLSPSEASERAIQLFFGGLLTPAGAKDYEKNFPN